MQRQKEVIVNSQKFTFQSVSPMWYYEQSDNCGNMGNGKHQSAKYMDIMFRNCVIAPQEVAAGGMSYFDEREDLKTSEALIREIESFLNDEGNPESARRRARRNKTFWCMIFTGAGISHAELETMDFFHYSEAVEARLLYQDEWTPKPQTLAAHRYYRRR
jgi:hypothetical protein